MTDCAKAGDVIILLDGKRIVLEEVLYSDKFFGLWIIEFRAPKSGIPRGYWKQDEDGGYLIQNQVIYTPQGNYQRQGEMNISIHFSPR